MGEVHRGDEADGGEPEGGAEADEALPAEGVDVHEAGEGGRHCLEWENKMIKSYPPLNRNVSKIQNEIFRSTSLLHIDLCIFKENYR